MADTPMKMSRRELMKSIVLGGIGVTGMAETSIVRQARSAPIARPIGSRNDAIRIGMIDPITGPYSTSSMHDIHGATVAVDMANASGGVLGRPVELLPVDDASDADRAREQAMTLIKDKRVDALIGSFNGEAALAVSEVAEREEKLFMVTCAHVDELTGASCRPSTFVYMPTASALSRAVAPRIVDAFGSRWFFINAQTIDGISAYSAMKHAVVELGGTDIGQAVTRFGESNFTDAFQEALSAHPDVVILNVYGWDLVHALKRAEAMNLPADMGIGGMIGGEQIGRPLGYAANRGIWGLTWDPKIPTRGSKVFIDGVVTKYRHTPTSRCYLGYAALTQTVNAIRRAGTTEVSALIKTLEGHRFDGLKTGPSYFRAWDHQHVQDVLVGKAFGKELGLGHYDILATVPGDDVAMRRDQTACRL